MAFCKGRLIVPVFLIFSSCCRPSVEFSCSFNLIGCFKLPSLSTDIHPCKRPLPACLRSLTKKGRQAAFLLFFERCSTWNILNFLLLT